jgi:hypothetical protein
MSQDRIFADEWRECLREQYMDVCRREDRRTGETLTRVMLQIGFTEADLSELRVRATMRDMPADFVPDMEVSAVELREPSVEEAVKTRHAVPSMPEPEILLAEDIVIDEEGLEEDSQDEPPDVEDPDSPEQLSLF